MNLQQKIEKRIKEIDESIKNYEKKVEVLEEELSNELVRPKQTELCRAIDSKRFHLGILKEVKRELEGVIK